MTSYRSLADMFTKRVAATPNGLAFQFPKADGGWGSMTWRESGQRVRAIAMGLIALGLQNEQRCAILASTRIEWILADLGIACAGGATTTVYPSNIPDECAYILSDSNTRVIFAESDEQVAKMLEIRSRLPGLEKVITFDGARSQDGWVITFAELIESGKTYDAANPGAFERVVASVEPQHLATLIYTSGTTGKPKGVELLHDCWVFEGEAIERAKLITTDDHHYLWLPLSHSFGKVLEAAQLACGFATTVDGRIDKLVENLAVIRPTVMAAAPRIFEKVYNRVITGAAEKGGLTLEIFRWATKVGKKVSLLRQQGTEPSGTLALQYKIADRLVFSKLRARFGGRVRYFISGSAPLSHEIAEFFHAAGILILEGYGLTESSAATFVNRPDSFKFGTVGLPFEGVEVKLAPEDGEVLIRGRGVMRGYHNLAETTADSIDSDGWLRTGDIGVLDEKGRLSITDRKKDLIKTSGGKYVAPQKLEGKLKALCPYVSQVVVHGDRRNFCSALVTLDEESIPKWAAENGLPGKDVPALVKEDRVIAMVQRSIDQLNAELASYETVKKFAILERDFTVETGELTASLKVKRKEVERRYREVLDGFYQGALERILMAAFDPLRYWEDRHQAAVGLSGVGYLGLKGYNEWMYRVRKRVFRRVLRPYAERLRAARVLDVGSGTGFYLSEWTRLKVGALTGCDFSTVALERLRAAFPALSIEHLDITTEDTGALDRLGRFDFVSIIDVLYHIVDDALYARAFQNLARLLAPGGVLVFTENFLQRTPRGGNAWQILRELREIEAAAARAELRITSRVPWFMLMNGPVDTDSRILKGGWWAIQKISGRSRIAGFAMGAAMYPAEVLLTKAFAESPTSEIALAEHAPYSNSRSMRDG